MKRFILEQKIAGVNFWMISASLVFVILLAAHFAGDLLNMSYTGFEVIFPFYTAVAVGEWGKIRCDRSYDIMKAQSKSLFSWVLFRFLTIFGTVSLFAVLGMAGTAAVRGEMAWTEMFLVYFGPAFFLSCISVLCSFLFTQEHSATLVCGALWLVMLLIRSLLRIKYVEYLYLFIRYAGDSNDIWLINKTVLTSAGVCIWGVIYLLCRKK